MNSGVGKKNRLATKFFTEQASRAIVTVTHSKDTFEQITSIRRDHSESQKTINSGCG
jgi:hypothetical protein